MAERSKTTIFGCSLAEIAGSNPAGGTDVCVVLYRKDKGTSQDNQDRQTSTEKGTKSEKVDFTKKNKANNLKTRSKVRSAVDRLGVAGSNPTRGIDVCVVWSK